MSASSGDNSCCVSDYPCSSTPRLTHPHGLNHIANSNPPSHRGPLGCRPESNECPPTDNGSTSGHFHHDTSDANVIVGTAATTVGSLSAVIPGNATTSSTVSLSPARGHNMSNKNCHSFYSSGPNCTNYPPNHTDSRINADVLLSRTESQENTRMSEKSSLARPLSVLPLSFQLKQESNLSPPTRSMSVHSLPGSLISPYHVGVNNTTTTHAILDPFIFSKREFLEDSELERRNESALPNLSYTGINNSNDSNASLPQIPHTMGYVTCSSFDPQRSAVLSQSHLIGTCLLPDSSSHMSLFPGHRTTTLSPLPLTVATGTDSNTTQGPSGTINRNPVNSTHLDVNSGLPMHLDSPGSTQHLTAFEIAGGEPGFACLLPPSSSTSTSTITVDSVNKRISSHGNGLCVNPGPCDLSTSNVPLGLSPRSKARRYSYPYEPVGLNKSATKDFHLPGQDRSNHTCSSPGLFRIIGTSNGNSITGNNMGNVNNYLPIGLVSSSGVAGEAALTPVGMNGSGGGGGRTLSTPMSSCGGEDVHQSGQLIGEHTHEQKPFMPQDDDVTLPGFSSPESAFYQYQHRMEGQRCQVCGELAAGFHHGAYVCEACKVRFHLYIRASF